MNGALFWIAVATPVLFVVGVLTGVAIGETLAASANQPDRNDNEEPADVEA